MLEFFKNIFRKLKNSLNQEKYTQSYKELINIFRRVTPLEIQDIDNIHTILRGIVENTTMLDRKMRILKNSLRSKALVKTRYDQFITDEFRKISKRTRNYDKDVSYSVGGKIIYGDVSSDEEGGYFSREHVENLNSIPLRPKKCDFDCLKNECRACMERRLRMEISKKLEIENQQLVADRIKKRKTNKDTINELNEKLGVPALFGRYVTDDAFKIDDLTEDERREFLKWKEEQKKSAEVARRILNLNQTQETSIPERSIFTEPNEPSRSFGFSRSAGGIQDIEEKTLKPKNQVFSSPLDKPTSSLSPLQVHENIHLKLEDQPIVQELNSETSSPITSIAEDDRMGKANSRQEFANPFKLGADVSEKSLGPPLSFTTSASKPSSLSFPSRIVGNQVKDVDLVPDNLFNNPFYKIGGPKESNSHFQVFQNPFTMTDANQMPKSSSLKADSKLKNPFSAPSSKPGATAENAPSNEKVDNPFADQRDTSPFFTGQINNQTANPFSTNQFNSPTDKVGDGLSTKQFTNPFATDKKNGMFLANNNQANSLQHNSQLTNPFSRTVNPFQLNNPSGQPESAAKSVKFEFNTSGGPVPQSNPYTPTNFEIGSRFSNQNIFQSDRAEKDDTGLFSADQAADDSFGRRRKAFRKR
ncbi:uncharacterized protein VICG_00982 [Vittaforma corneae ATCC 50505]|uniref:Uncharacterized protein n=1 Tax=Vittaforma corneae (strain ATCC 50505) TaxID=993615 RepID=L2GN89_VITCO|nr:uncharacterized protein VICG_00982 [Vittaforma corneae ATCC 50505]ELA41965.1 hypothetical protein VICG_00982 [Vittaforma corneae ATCC 50505]